MENSYSKMTEKVMSIDFTTISIKMILWNALLICLIAIQQYARLNIFPAAIEGFAIILVGCFEVYVISFFFIAILSELKKISSALSDRV